MRDSGSDQSLVAEFRSALADEVRAARTGPSSDPTRLLRGRRIARFGDVVHYRFEAERDLPKTLVEDAPAQLHIGQDSEPVRIVAHAGLEVTLALPDDLGERIHEAALVWDLTFLLEELRERLLARVGADNHGGALLLGEARASSHRGEAAARGLNPEQAAAVGHALANDCTYIWGPPGTGKTQTIGTLTAELVRRNRSVLLVSHTNVAIDEAILRAADALGDEVPDGRFLRLGAAYGPRLAERPRLLAETHVREAAAELREAITHAEKTRDELRRAVLDAQRTVDLAQWLRESSSGILELERVERAVSRAVDHIAAVERELAAGRCGEVESRRAQRGLREALQRRRELLERLMHTPEHYGIWASGSHDDAVSRLADAQVAASKELDAALLPQARAEVDAVTPRLAALDRRISGLREALKSLSNELLHDAQVVGCTLTAAYLRRAIGARTFDTVVIDEASIAPIPAAWFAANLATRAVVAVGDFRQLPPIVLAETPIAQRWLGRDVFEASGVRDAYERDESPSSLLALTTQHRMAPRISAIPNRLSYRGLLKDGAGTDDERELDGWLEPRAGLTAPVMVLELASLQTWATTVRRGTRSSRINVLSAIATVDLACGALRHEREPLLDEQARRALVVSPYRPQAELLGAMLRARGLEQEVTAGTIHAFQGSEASLVILDLTVAAPHYRAAIFSRDFDESQRRMLNVAVTRARRRLVVVTDRPFIRAHAADGTALHVLRRELIGARELAPSDILRLADLGEIALTTDQAEREIIWFVADADREPELTDRVLAAARRGVTICVVTQAGREARLDLRDSALSRLRRAGAAVFTKSSLREALVLVDGRSAAVRPATSKRWSVWHDASVASQISRAHQVSLLLAFAANNSGGTCARCGHILELREGDHSRPGVYVVCSSCGKPSSARAA
jgi:hypothetical protein